MPPRRRQARGYSYGIHYAPHDAASDNIQTGRSIRDTAAECGLDFEVAQRGSVAAGINAVRQLRRQCWFDDEHCAEGLDALERYADEWSPELQMFSQKPEHSRFSHAADAFRTFAVGYERPLEDDGWRPSPRSCTSTCSTMDGSSDARPAQNLSDDRVGVRARRGDRGGSRLDAGVAPGADMKLARSAGAERRGRTRESGLQRIIG